MQLKTNDTCVYEKSIEILENKWISGKKIKMLYLEHKQFSPTLNLDS